MIDTFPYWGFELSTATMTAIGFFKQSQIFQLFLTSGSFLFYVSYTAALLGAAWILIRHSWWKFSVIVPFLMTYIILCIGTSFDVVFWNVNISNDPILSLNDAPSKSLSVEYSRKVQKIYKNNEKAIELPNTIRVFMPQAVLIHLFSTVQYAISNGFNQNDLWANSMHGKSPALQTLRTSRLDNITKHNIENFKRICSKHSLYTDRFIGLPINEIIKEKEGVGYLNSLATTMFDFNDVYILNKHYFETL
jgi:hypothetical protein